MAPRISPDEFMASSPQHISPQQYMATAPRGVDGNSEWASRYARELRGVVVRQANRAPRSLQVHLGPSEIGAACDRQVIGKLAGIPRTNHVSDPWPSICGTAIHAWLADAFEGDNAREHILRWVTETKVVPHPDYPGHADLYDALERCVVDHKCLGPTSLSKVKSVEGPSRRYVVQLLLYAAGVRAAGLPVTRVVLAAWPRTASTLDGMYVWEHVCTPADEILIAEVLDQMAARQAAAQMIRDGYLTINQVAATPDATECLWCPLYRPQAAYDNGPGCPGTVTRRA